MPHFDLFDLVADPGETKDVAVVHPEIVAKLKEHYEQWVDAGWAGGQMR